MKGAAGEQLGGLRRSERQFSHLLTNLPDLTLRQSAVDPLRVNRWTATDNGARLRRRDGPSLIAQQQDGRHDDEFAGPFGQ